MDTLNPPSHRDPSGRSTADRNDEHNSAKIAIDARSVFANTQEDVGVQADSFEFVRPGQVYIDYLNRNNRGVQVSSLAQTSPLTDKMNCSTTALGNIKS